jgi:hypothetical protein
MNVAERFIYGEIDWDYVQAKLKEWGPVMAGALFGAGDTGVPEIIRWQSSPRNELGGGINVKPTIVLVLLNTQDGGAGRTPWYMKRLSKVWTTLSSTTSRALLRRWPWS